MSDIILGEMQSRFADLIWENAPINSGKLAKLAEEELHWKKPTTYTVLRILCQKGLFRNEGGVVSALISREAFYASKSRQVVEESFHGSLPAFVAAFISRKDLTAGEAEEIQKMIDAFREGERP